MPFGFLRDEGGDRLDHVEATLQRMFSDDRHAFDLAMAALLGGAVPIFDLAADGARLLEGPEAATLRQLRDEISRFIAEAGEVFAARDAERARPLLARGDALLDAFDERVSALVRGDGPALGAVAQALLYRYLKRIVAHLMNVLSAVVMPVDQLDYFDEDPEDRR